MLVEDCEVNVKAYEMQRNGVAVLSTVYPETGTMTPACQMNYVYRAQTIV